MKDIYNLSFGLNNEDYVGIVCVHIFKVNFSKFDPFCVFFGERLLRYSSSIESAPRRPTESHFSSCLKIVFLYCG